MLNLKMRLHPNTEIWQFLLSFNMCVEVKSVKCGSTKHPLTEEAVWMNSEIFHPTHPVVRVSLWTGPEPELPFNEAYFLKDKS